MSFKEKKLLETNKYQLSIQIEKPAFDEAIAKVFKKKSKNIQIPGFRRGKAPRAIVEKMYGAGIFYEDAVNELLPAAYEEAEKELDFEVVGRPSFDIETIDENGVVILATVFSKPEVKVSEYKGLTAVKAPFTVEDGEIDAEIDRARERNARISDITDRACENGDIANIDFDGYVDGKAFDGGKSEKFDLTIGSGQFIPGFEEQIIGKNIGEEFDVNVTFPADYNAEELAGKEAVFKCKLNGLKVKELPEADDELATLASEFDTLAEYKADIKAKITDRKDKSAENEVANQLMEKLVENLEADIPECMFDEETEACLRDMDSNLQMQGLNLKTYLQYTGMELDGLRADLRPRAINQVKSRLALEKVAELEKIEATDEEAEAEMQKIADSYRVELEEVKKIVAADDLKKDIKVRKAVEFVRANAVITDEAPAEENKPAKKPAAKKTTAKKTTTKKADADAEEKAEKAPAKKTAAKKTTTKKADAETAEKAPAKKTATKKTAAKKTEE